MGKIMLNGIQYGVGGIEQAKDISYDNTESGATATDVQGALDELNNGLIHTVAITQTTDSSGNLTLTNYSPADYTFIGGYSDRTVCPDAMRVFISTTATGAYYLLNIGNSTGGVVANRSVRVIIAYLENN